MNKDYQDQYRFFYNVGSDGCSIYQEYEEYLYICIYSFNASTYIPLVYKNKQVKSTIYFRNLKGETNKKVLINNIYNQKI